jgi:hypothetical protein
MYIHQAAEYSKYLEQPYDQNNDDDNIQDFFDVAIHRDERIH